jgi:NAD(P)H-dependent FMN reductase
MPRESYDVRALRSKAVASLRTGVTAFNGLDHDGQTVVLLSVQHAFEMLLKAVLAAKKNKTIFDKKTQQSVSLEGSIRRCQQLDGVKLTEEESARSEHSMAYATRNSTGI